MPCLRPVVPRLQSLHPPRGQLRVHAQSLCQGLAMEHFSRWCEGRCIWDDFYAIYDITISWDIKLGYNYMVIKSNKTISRDITANYN